MRLFMIVSSLVLLAAEPATAESLSSEVLGKWSQLVSGISTTLELAPNGRCTTSGKPCRWEINDQRYLKITDADGKQNLGLWFDRGVLSMSSGTGSGLNDNYLVYYRLDAQGNSTRPDAQAKAACEKPVFAPARILKGKRYRANGLDFTLAKGWAIKGDSAPYSITNPAFAPAFATLYVEGMENALNHIVLILDGHVQQHAAAFATQLNAQATLIDAKVFRVGAASGASIAYRAGTSEVHGVGVRLGDQFYSFLANGPAGTRQLAEAQALIETAVIRLKVGAREGVESGRACYELGLSYQRGLGNPQDLTVAADFYRRGCELKSGVACYMLAGLLSTDPGVLKKSDTEGDAALKKSCDVGLAIGCQTMAAQAPAEPLAPAPARPAESRAAPKTLVKSIAIPAGTYQYQGTKTTEVKAFELGETATTVEAYAQCVSAGACTEPKTGEACNWGTNRMNHPINCVNWNQAAAFCRWIGGRLPTEEEREYVASAGDEARTYPWGNEAPGVRACWEGEGNGLGKGKLKTTCPVGSYRAGDSRWGLHDLAGNVWEWTSSDFDSKNKVLRGGAWFSEEARFLQARRRSPFVTSDSNELIGFRCAMGR